MTLNDLLADGQSYTGAGELFAFVQPLEHAKNSFEVPRIDSQSVVLHREYPFLRAILGRGDVYLGNSGALVFDGVADKVLKQLNQLLLVRQDGGQRIVRHQRTAF